MSILIDFTAARNRLSVEHSIDIDARAIPVELEIKPSATFIELLRRLTDAELVELVNVTLEESK